MRLLAAIVMAVVLLAAPGAALLQAASMPEPCCSRGAGCGHPADHHSPAKNCATCCDCCPFTTVAVLSGSNDLIPYSAPVARVDLPARTALAKNYPPPVPPPRVACS